MRILAVAVAALILVPGLQPCSAQTTIPHFWDGKERLPKPDLTGLLRLRFLTTTDFFPFNFLDSSGRLAGFHVDLARAICAVLEMEDRCQIQALPFEELETALEEGQGEALLAGLAVTRERRERLLFTRSYMAFPARFVAPRQAPLPEPLYEGVADKRIGVIAGTAHEQMLGDLFSQARAVTYTNREELTEDLKEGEIDGAFGDGMRLSFWLAGEEADDCCAFAGGPYLAPEYLGHGLTIAVPRDASELAAALDHALQQVQENGTFAELYLRYFPVGFY